MCTTINQAWLSRFFFTKARQRNLINLLHYLITGLSLFDCKFTWLHHCVTWLNDAHWVDSNSLFTFRCSFIFWCRDTTLMLSLSKFNRLNYLNRYCVMIASCFVKSTSVIWNIACNLYSVHFLKLYFWWKIGWRHL